MGKTLESLYYIAGIILAIVAVTENVTDFPITLSVSPNTGKQGTIFTFSGEGFTPNGAIKFHSKNQNGSDWFKKVTASSSGSFSYADITSTARAAGIYDIWAIESATGRKSNYVQEIITK